MSETGLLNVELHNTQGYITFSATLPQILTQSKVSLPVSDDDDGEDDDD